MQFPTASQARPQGARRARAAYAAPPRPSSCRGARPLPTAATRICKCCRPSHSRSSNARPRGSSNARPSRSSGARTRPRPRTSRCRSPSRYPLSRYATTNAAFAAKPAHSTAVSARLASVLAATLASRLVPGHVQRSSDGLYVWWSCNAWRYDRRWRRWRCCTCTRAAADECSGSNYFYYFHLQFPLLSSPGVGWQPGGQRLIPIIVWDDRGV